MPYLLVACSPDGEFHPPRVHIHQQICSYLPVVQGDETNGEAVYADPNIMFLDDYCRLFRGGLERKYVGLPSLGGHLSPRAWYGKCYYDNADCEYTLWRLLWALPYLLSRL